MSPEQFSEDGRAQAAARDFSATTLGGMPDAFERLVYLASLRELSSDAYAHWGLENVYGPEAAQEALRRLHLDIFREVGALPLPQLAGQMERFLSGRAEGGRVLLRNWKRDQAYNVLAPAGVNELERESFRINFEAVMEAFSPAPSP